MTALVVKPAVIEWFLEQVPGASREEVERWKENGEIVIEGEDNGN